MSPRLTTPDRERSTENRDDAPFPYGDGSGHPLPRPATRGVLRSSEPTGAVGAAGSRTCPACGDETVDGAGLFACTVCEWSGRLR